MRLASLRVSASCEWVRVEYFPKCWVPSIECTSLSIRCGSPNAVERRTRQRESRLQQGARCEESNWWGGCGQKRGKSWANHGVTSFAWKTLASLRELGRNNQVSMYKFSAGFFGYHKKPFPCGCVVQTLSGYLER